MNHRVGKSMGIVTLVAEALAKIKPTEPLRFATRAARKKRNCSDSSGNSPAKILASRCTCKKSRRTKTRPEVLTVTGRKTLGVSPIRVQLTIIFILAALFEKKLNKNLGSRNKLTLRASQDHYKSRPLQVKTITRHEGGRRIVNFTRSKTMI